METSHAIENLDRLIEYYEDLVDKKKDKIDEEREGEEFLPFDEWFEMLKPEATILSQLCRIKRFVEPVTSWDELPDYGDVYSIEEFKGMCECGGFIDYDGHGNYVKDGKESNVMVKPSDIMAGFVRDKEFDSVVWFNR